TDKLFRNSSFNGGFLNPCAWHHFAINDDDTLSADHQKCIGCLTPQLECAVTIFQRFDVSVVCGLSKRFAGGAWMKTVSTASRASPPPQAWHIPPNGVAPVGRV
ncbi:hypothetical protein WCE14_16330, partial [Acinetobacter schindleri]|uniref:hypothetical protein n=1 Tax=Acinetobacter schindleri TaxID=108981 RepID=UPI0034D650E6